MRWLPTLLLLAWAAAAGAGQGEPAVLTVTGPDGRDAVTFTRSALAALPQRAVTTTTPWTDGAARFTGPGLCRVLEAAGAEGTIVRAHALNDYAAEIPVADCRRYPVILALARNGAQLSRRDKGPIWIVYPQSAHPELDRAAVHARWVWQLTRLTVR